MFYAPIEMAERILLGPAVNKLLWPRLRELGFRFHSSEGGETWKEGRSIVRVGKHGRDQFLLLGRAKFGHQIGMNVSRQLPDGSMDWLDLGKVGLSPETLSYRNQSEAEAVVGRIAVAMNRQVVPWLDEDPPSSSLSARSRNDAAQ